MFIVYYNEEQKKAQQEQQPTMGRNIGTPMNGV